MMYAHSCKCDSKVILQNNVGMQSNTDNQWCGTFFFFWGGGVGGSGGGEGVQGYRTSFRSQLQDSSYYQSHA